MRRLLSCGKTREPQQVRNSGSQPSGPAFFAAYWEYLELTSSARRKCQSVLEAVGPIWGLVQLAMFLGDV